MQGKLSSHILYIRDTIFGRQFLVDTGAEVSVFPVSGRDTREQESDGELQTANGSTCRTYGKRQLKISVDGRTFTWSFVIAEVTQPLLGADFLCDHGLIVDIKGKRLVEWIISKADKA